MSPPIMEFLLLIMKCDEMVANKRQARLTFHSQFPIFHHLDNFNNKKISFLWEFFLVPKSHFSHTLGKMDADIPACRLQTCLLPANEGKLLCMKTISARSSID
ncbi:hypothetical protein AV540_22685 [Brevibacillus parabrevis]|nr:hypothetical protein AV540_22685 [Brevibacillus parabrevis]